MKITQSKIRKWDFKQRLIEIGHRVRTVNDAPNPIDPFIFGNLDEALKIIDYWLEHMNGGTEKPKKKNKIKKSCNLFNK